ncbi:BnaCnng75270D [Brassica napus]|uniref:BnaCnng75270D protein n=1 Tax=Brassica napus TaxID=3708 RepID=A0A078JZ36_BRANA|nr:BnaCnng75270D [Brassica napus]
MKIRIISYSPVEAAAKAAIRAQKKAEKKEQKEREKAEVPEAFEAEKEEIEAPVEEKSKKEKKVLKEKPIRNMIRNRGGLETLPRLMRKRKKQTNYMVWAAPAAVVVLMLLDLGYYYVF